MNVSRAETPHKGATGSAKPTMVIIHGDAGKSDKGTIAWLKDPNSKVSYHYLVGRDGSVHQFVDEDAKAWHAGLSKYQGEEVAGSVNPISIGVAFANDGTGKEPYTPAQYKAGGELVAEICKRRRIPFHRVRSHAEVSPGRKTDPWAHFSWDAFYLAFGRHSRRI